MKIIPRSPQSIWLAKEIYEPFAQAVKAQGMRVCTVLEEFMRAFAGANPIEEGESQKMQYISVPKLPYNRKKLPQEIAQEREHHKRTLLQWMDVAECLECGHILTLDKIAKEYREKKGIPWVCECGGNMEVFEHAPQSKV